MAKLVVNSESLVSVADAIREKGGTTEELEFPQGFVDGINAIESGGGGTEEIENIIDQSGVLGTTDETVTVTEKVEQLIEKAEDENLWYGHFNNLTYAERLFYEYSFPRLPKLPALKPKTTLAYWFSNMAVVKTIDFYIDVAPTTTIAMNSIFAESKNLVSIVGINTLMGKDGRSMFSNCRSLETIQKPLNFLNMTNLASAFYYCDSLKNISFVPETIKVSITIPSPVLSNESIESILNGLAPVETEQMLTLTQSLYVKVINNDRFRNLINEARDKGWDMTYQ